LRVDWRLNALLAVRRDAVVVVREHRTMDASIYWLRERCES